MTTLKRAALFFAAMVSWAQTTTPTPVPLSLGVNFPAGTSPSIMVVGADGKPYAARVANGLALRLSVDGTSYELVAVPTAPVTPPIVPDPVVMIPTPTKFLTKSDDLQAAINAAKGGDTITLKHGDIWVGNFTLPVRADTGVVTIQSDGVLPAAGIRLNHAKGDAAQLATIQTPQELPAIATVNNTSGWTFKGIEFAPVPTSKLVYNLIVLGVPNPTKTADMPQNIEFDHVWIHGLSDPTYQNNYVRGIWPGIANLRVVDSEIDTLYSNFMEAGCIAGDTAVGPIQVLNSHLQCAGENFMLGTNQILPTGWVPKNITLRGNLIDKDTAWRDDPKAAGIIVKNLTEFKNVDGVVEDKNVLMSNWQRNQNGYAALFTPRTQNGAMPWVVTSNIVFTNNIIRHVVGGMMQARFDSNKGTLTEAQLTPSVGFVVRNNLFSDLSAKYASPTTNDTNVIAFSLYRPDGVVIDHNTVQSARYGQYLNNAACPPLPPDALTFTNNVIDAPTPISANCTSAPSALPPTTVFSGNYFPQFAAASSLSKIWTDAYPDLAKTSTTAGADLTMLKAVEAAVLAGTPLP